MKLLVLGTSHSACLRMAEQAGAHHAFSEIVYYSVALGTGPAFKLNDDLTVDVTKSGMQRTQHYYPENRKGEPVSNFDVVLFSAIEAFALTLRPVSTNGHVGVVHRFKPKQPTEALPLVSEPLARAHAQAALETCAGVTLLRDLAKRTCLPIFIQCAPLPAESLKNQSDWSLNTLYDDPLAAHRYYMECGREFLSGICREVHAEFLDIPEQEWIASGFTPSALMSSDMAHGNAEYGARIFAQVSGRLSSRS